MSGKRKYSFSRFIFSLVTIIPTLFNTVRHVVLLVEHEARIAKKRIVMLCVLMMIFFSLIISTWFCIIVMFFVYLISLQLSWQLSLAFILILNLLILMIVSLLIINLKRGVFFPETRELIKSVYKNDSKY